MTSQMFDVDSVEQAVHTVLQRHTYGHVVRQECRCGGAPGYLTLAEHQAEMVAQAIRSISSRIACDVTS